MRQTWATNLGALDKVDVQLSTAGVGGPYTTLSGGANLTATAKTSNVVVPSTPTTTARLRVIWTNPPSGSSASGTNPGNFKVEAPFLTVTAPTAGAVWKVGTAQTIKWTSNIGSAENVEIRLSQDGGATYPTVVTASTASDGSQGVTVPSTWGNQTTTRVKVTWLKTPTLLAQSANFTVTP
jgi:hypothetical protein